MSRGRQLRRGNPEAAAADRFEIFHGNRPDKVFEFSQSVHEHSVLSGIGKLERLFILDLDGDLVELASFRGAILTQNEEGNQIYISGGDQGVNLGDFGINRDPHELELLGTLTRVWYHTTKVHLDPRDGGTATYDHEFGGRGKRRPVITYDVRNRQLAIVGGDYSILPEGIFE